MRGKGSGTAEVQVAATAGELRGCGLTPPIPTHSHESHTTLMLTRHARLVVPPSHNNADGERRHLFSKLGFYAACLSLLVSISILFPTKP